MNKTYAIDHEAEHAKAVLPELVGALCAARDQMEQCEKMFRDDESFMAALADVRAAIAQAVAP
jgi:hypothetical protein